MSSEVPEPTASFACASSSWLCAVFTSVSCSADARLRLQHAQVLLRDRGAELLARAGDVRIDGVAVRHRGLRVHERRAVDAVVQVQPIARLDGVGAVAEREAVEHLLAALLVARAEASGPVRAPTGARRLNVDSRCGAFGNRPSSIARPGAQSFGIDCLGSLFFALTPWIPSAGAIMDIAF